MSKCPVTVIKTMADMVVVGIKAQGSAYCVAIMLFGPLSVNPIVGTSTGEIPHDEALSIYAEQVKDNIRQTEVVVQQLPEGLREYTVEEFDSTEDWRNTVMLRAMSMEGIKPC